MQPSSQPAAKRVPLLLTAKHQTAPPLESQDLYSNTVLISR
jgi:hypothetical protein